MERPLLHNLFVEPWPIRDTAVHPTNVDEIKTVLGVDPIAARIIDFELKVRRNLAGLGWR